VSDRSLFIVLSNPTEGREDEFNDWYEKVHLRDVLSVPGVAAAQRYALAPMPESDAVAKPSHSHLAVYELDDEPAEVIGRFFERVSTGKMVLSESLDLATVVMHAWKPCGARQLSESEGTPVGGSQ
jgi:hypothetical protein